MPDHTEQGSLGGPSPSEGGPSPGAGSFRRVLTEDTAPEGGCRVERYLVLRGAEGCLCGVTGSAVVALCECDAGCLLLLSGGGRVRTTHPRGRLLTWLA